jgi:hypothetical protein
MAQPRCSIPLQVLETTGVEINGAPYQAHVERGLIKVPGASLPVTWAAVVGDEVTITLGAKVPPLLDEIPTDRIDPVLAGALIIASIVGHPRQSPRGRPIRFVWTDHVALAFRSDPALALKHSWVRDPSADHIERLAGSIRLLAVGPGQSS